MQVLPWQDVLIMFSSNVMWTVLFWPAAAVFSEHNAARCISITGLKELAFAGFLSFLTGVTFGILLLVWERIAKPAAAQSDLATVIFAAITLLPSLVVVVIVSGISTCRSVRKRAMRRRPGSLQATVEAVAADADVASKDLGIQTEDLDGDEPCTGGSCLGSTCASAAAAEDIVFGLSEETIRDADVFRKTI